MRLYMAISASVGHRFLHLVNGLFSCLLSRGSIKRNRFRLSARTLDFEGAHGRRQGQRRRLIKLSCAGWLPHDRGFVLGLPRSRSERRRCRLITGHEDSPRRPASCPGHQIWSSSVLSGDRPELYLPSDRPQEADHLACNGSGDDHLGFAGRRRAAIAGAQPDLGFPGDIADSLRQALVTVMELADVGLHAIGPRPLDQSPPVQSVASLGDAAASDGDAARML